ncbi:MAG: sulfatase-like hydrolase/transferase, partial [Spirochaetia bacterium]|nr:sulfatase-like hydrolase/transferase [Spirochaetia bacterium]
MTDQHNARATGFAGHPVVKTPHLDRLASEATVFENAFCNNPICGPSRTTFTLGQYPRTHGYFGNIHFPEGGRSDYLASVLRRAGYQTGLVGKSHTARSWDAEGFEKIWYTGFCDALPEDPLTNHYFKYLADLGLEDLYEEGSENKSLPEAFDGSRPWPLPYEYSPEH